MSAVFVLTLWTKSAITLCDNLFLLKFLTYIIMKPSEFEDLYCFFNEQITAQREMLKEKTVLRENIRRCLRSLEQQKQKIVKRFALDFPQVWQVNSQKNFKEDLDVLFTMLVKYPELCRGIELHLILYFEFIQKVLGSAKDKAYLKAYLPLLSRLLCSDIVCFYVCEEYGKREEVTFFFEWVKKHVFDEAELQRNVNNFVENVSKRLTGTIYVI